MTATEKIILFLARGFFAALPFERGKQTTANAIYVKLLPRIKGQAKLKAGTIKYLLDLHDRIQAIFYLTNLYETKTLNAALRILSQQKSNPVILDVGANVGLLSLQIKNRIPTAQIHMFEADPTVYRQLEKNISLNQVTGLKLNNLAVSASNGDTLTFVKSQLSTESGWGRIENDENRNHLTEKFQVRSISIDQYLKENEIDHVDLLKIDVEGAETLVLSGARQALEAQIFQTIICEINPEALAAFSSSPEEVIYLLTHRGYEVSEQADMNTFFRRKPKR